MIAIINGNPERLIEDLGSSTLNRRVAVTDPISVANDKIQQMEGALEVLRRENAALLARLAVRVEAADKWNHAMRHQADLGAWLVDKSTDDSGKVIKNHVDAALGGEDVVPCTFRTVVCGRKYLHELVSTEYRTTEEVYHV
jgi:hypothetical protein